MTFGGPLDLRGGPWEIHARFLMDLGSHFGRLGTSLFENIVLWTMKSPHTHSKSCLEACLMDLWSSREGSEPEKPLKFIVQSSKIKVEQK